MEHPISVTMLGRFAIAELEQAPGREISLTGRSRRLWTLVAYLIIHRDRGVPAQELIDLLWPEAENSSPINTLQNNVSRARTALGELGIANAKSLIRYENGLYRWAPEAETRVDYDEFERLAKLALQKTDSEAFLPPALEAVGLYVGDFLPEAAMELWCINLNAYYRSLYLRLCRRTVKELMAAERTAEAQQICTEAIRIDPTVEEFSIALMQALVQDGNPRKALEHYDHLRQLFRDTYGVTPSQDLELEKAAAIRELYGQDMGEQELVELLQTPQDETGAFYCDNNTFREIVNLHIRERKRNKTDSQVVLIHLKVTSVSAERQALHMKQMEAVLTRCLRAGDPFTRIGASRFAVLLPGANPENGDMVMKRVLRHFHSEYPNTGASFSYIVKDLDEM